MTRRGMELTMTTIILIILLIVTLMAILILFKSKFDIGSSYIGDIVTGVEETVYNIDLGGLAE